MVSRIPASGLNVHSSSVSSYTFVLLSPPLLTEQATAFVYPTECKITLMSCVPRHLYPYMHAIARPYSITTV
jgi:hypothetical protein